MDALEQVKNEFDEYRRESEKYEQGQADEIAACEQRISKEVALRAKASTESSSQTLTAKYLCFDCPNRSCFK